MAVKLIVITTAVSPEHVHALNHSEKILLFHSQITADRYSGGNCFSVIS